MLQNDVAPALGARREAAQVLRLVDIDRVYFELVDVGAFVVLGVGDRGFEDALDDLRALLRTEGEDVERLADRQPANLVGDEPPLLRREAHAAEDGFGFHG